jgi:hypothetical protein
MPRRLASSRGALRSDYAFFLLVLGAAEPSCCARSKAILRSGKTYFVVVGAGHGGGTGGLRSPAGEGKPHRAALTWSGRRAASRGCRRRDDLTDALRKVFTFVNPRTLFFVRP